MAESPTGGGVGFWTVLTGWTGWAARVKLPPSGDRWLRAAGGYGLFVAIRCQAVVRCELSLHRLATGGYGRRSRWLRDSSEGVETLPSGGMTLALVSVEKAMNEPRTQGDQHDQDSSL